MRELTAERPEAAASTGGLRARVERVLETRIPALPAPKLPPARAEGSFASPNEVAQELREAGVGRIRTDLNGVVDALSHVKAAKFDEVASAYRQRYKAELVDDQSVHGRHRGGRTQAVRQVPTFRLWVRTGNPPGCTNSWRCWPKRKRPRTLATCRAFPFHSREP